MARWARSILFVALLLGAATIIHLSSTLKGLLWNRIPQVFDSSHHEDGTDKDNNISAWTIPIFSPGSAKPPGSSYKKGLTIARMKHEDTSWIEEEDLDVERYIYVVDDPDARLQPPKNKGHEAVVYLTFIIDFYHALPDITMFMHAHRYTHHNNPILDSDAAAMIRNFSSERVIREGYVNMRCNLNPGCPNMLDWYGPFGEHKAWKQEIVNFWQKLNPGQPIPTQMSQPCCAQFAVSRERIQETPLEQYIFYRDWLLQLPESDADTGRTWEYLWHYIFTGTTVSCPTEFECYCDVYGICFEGVGELRRWFIIQEEIGVIEEQIQTLRVNESLSDNSEIIQSQQAMELNLQQLKGEGETLRANALQRGEDPKIRAEAANRSWNDGDGY